MLGVTQSTPPLCFCLRHSALAIYSSINTINKMTIKEFKTRNDKGEINIFTNEIFLGEDIKKPFNVSFITSKPDISVRDINYTKNEEQRKMTLASVNMMATDSKGVLSPLSVTINSQLVTCFEGTIDTDKVYGAEGQGVVAESGSEYNRYTFTLAPLLATEPAE